MSLSNPLLKELKSQIFSLINSDSEQEPYSDKSHAVFLLCLTLEKIFSKGLKRHDGFTPWKTDPFQWFYQLVRKYQKVIPLTFKVAFEEALANCKTKTETGKTRLLLRICLVKKCLSVPVDLHVSNRDFNDSVLKVSHDPSNSILGHEILSTVFLSLLQQLGCYDFNFDLTNCAFLDESWQLPSTIKLEIVPCTKLGLTLGFPMGFPLIVEILENSCAAEYDALIGIGDIIDEINGVFVRNYFGSKIDQLFKKIKSKPFQITVIKGINPISRQIYLPIIKLYRIVGLDPELISSEKFSTTKHSTISKTTNIKTNVNEQQNSQLDIIDLC